MVALFTNLGFPLILAGQPARRADRLHVPAGLEAEWARHPASGQQRAEFALSDLLTTCNGTQTLENVEKYGRQWLLGASYHF